MTQKCICKGCRRVVLKKTSWNGSIWKSNYCAKHYATMRQRLNKDRMRLKRTLNTEKCSKCGWAGPCDLHRIHPGSKGGKYVKENVVVLCPNCHRLEDERYAKEEAPLVAPS